MRRGEKEILKWQWDFIVHLLTMGTPVGRMGPFKTGGCYVSTWEEIWRNIENSESKKRGDMNG